MASERDVVNCPYCAEEILRAAVKCKHCGEDLRGSTTAAPEFQPGRQSAKPKKPRSPGSLLCTLLTLAGAGLLGLMGFNFLSQGNVGDGVTLCAAGAAFLVLGPLGWRLGDVIRRALMPDSIWVSEFRMLVWSKIFWAIGPQLVGFAAMATLLIYGASLVSAHRTEEPKAVPTPAIADSQAVEPKAQAASAESIEASPQESSGELAAETSPADEGNGGHLPGDSGEANSTSPPPNDAPPI